MNSKTLQIFLVMCLFFSTSIAKADVISELLMEYNNQGTSAFSASTGKALWMKKQQDRSCTSCHTLSVKNTGKHQRTGKQIKPMAPSVNPERLTDKKKIKKWLLRNCKWTFKRECNAQEKGNILIWLQNQ